MKEMHSSEELDNKYFLAHKDWKQKRIEALRNNIVGKRVSHKVEEEKHVQEQLTPIDDGSFVTCAEWRTIHEVLQIADDEMLQRIQKKSVTTDSLVFTIKTTKRTVLLNIAIVLLCLTGTFFSLRAYYNAINTSFVKLDEDPIGSIVYRYKVAQRKMTDHVAWDRLQQNTPIYNGDLIRTAELSEATITFLAGSSIDLYDQTLTQVYYDENGAVIDFSGGEISVNTTNSQTGITLIAGETKVNLNKGAVLNANAQTTQENGITTFAASPIALQLAEGDAQITVTNNGEQEHIAVDTGSAVVLDPTTNAVDVQPLTLVSPSTQLAYIKNKHETLIVPFEWQVQDSEHSIQTTLEISAYKDFSEIAHAHTFENTTSASIPFDAGSWYWRLFTEGSDLTLSGKVSILEIDDFEYITPNESDSYFYRTKTPSVRFVWSDDENVSQWLLEIADNAGMKNPIVSQSVTQPSSIIHTLEDGNWFWRVTPKYSDRYTLSENIRTYTPEVKVFSVVQQAELLATTLLSPAMYSFVNTQNVETPQFVWKYDREASLYTIIVSKNEDLSNPIITEQTNDTFFALEKYASIMDEGMWYWAVTKTDTEENISPIGTIGTFYAIDGEVIYDTSMPENGEVFTEQTIHETQFTWQNNIPFTTFLQVSNDISFSDVIIEQKINTDLTQGFVDNLPIPQGMWYWRTVSKNEKTGLEYSTDAKHFFVDFTLSEVVLLNPQESATLKTHEDYRQTFSWQGVEHADYYTFSLYSKNNLETPVYEQKEHTQTTLRLDISGYADGDYEWHVKAVSNSAPSKRVQETNVAMQSFTINAIKPVVLTGLSPSVQLTGVSALINPQSIGWASSEPIVSSEFILSTSNRGLRVSDVENGIGVRESDAVMRVQNPSRSIELPPLTEGTYYWTVIARTTGGIDIRAVQPRTITVLPITLLASVTNMSPEQNIVLYNSDILKGFINFSWNGVENADEYLFVLYNQHNEVLWEKTVIGDTSVHFDAISLLDRGTFTWTVEAKRNLPTGIIQNGIIAENNFSIDIGEPVIPKDKTQGGQYGF